MSHILLNYAFLLFWSIFVENSQRTFLFRPKRDYLWYEQWNTQKICFSYHFWKEQILRKFWICLNNFFFQTSKRGKILTKTVFLHKMSYILLNYAFLLFWIFFGEILREIFFFCKKSGYLRNEHWYTQKVVFLTTFEGEILRKIWVCLNNCFWANQ